MNAFGERENNLKGKGTETIKVLYFFLIPSCMIEPGFIRLDDTTNGVQPRAMEP